jgi:hypothetical protein
VAYGAIGLALALTCAAAYRMNRAEQEPPIPEPANTPVLVELFTSQGCHNCPAADAVLSKLVNRPMVDGVNVIALSWHVDYWDELGWPDPFASSTATSRQKAYAEQFKPGRVYTPQMVVDGARTIVGSDVLGAKDLIDRSGRNQKALMDIRAVGESVTDGVRLRVRAARLPVARENLEVDVYLIVTENGLSNAVTAGENHGKTLKHTAVVRAVEKVGYLSCNVTSTFSGTVVVPIKANWRDDQINFVAIAQDRNSLEVLGVGQRSLLEIANPNTHM